MFVLYLDYFTGFGKTNYMHKISSNEDFHLQRDVVMHKLFFYTLMYQTVSSKPVFSIRNCVYEQRQTEPNYTQMYVQRNQNSDPIHMSEVGQKIELDHNAIISVYHKNNLVWQLRFEKEPDQMS